MQLYLRRVYYADSDHISRQTFLQTGEFAPSKDALIRPAPAPDGQVGNDRSHNPLISIETPCFCYKFELTISPIAAVTWPQLQNLVEGLWRHDISLISLG